MRKSGLMSNEKWTENYFRVFLSHKSAYKEQTTKLKEELEKYGISAFVAHNDIEPSKEWQSEIERALFSMDAFVALITKDFYESEWTNQEIGFSMAFNNIPHVYVKFGDNNPRGFAAKFQALSCSWENSSEKILDILLQESNKMLNTFISSLQNAASYKEAKDFFYHLIKLELNEEQCDKVIYAYNNCSQINECNQFNGISGQGIIPHLNEWSKKKYKLTKNNRIIENPACSLDIPPHRK
jgi:hypothetical protein